MIETVLSIHSLCYKRFWEMHDFKGPCNWIVLFPPHTPRPPHPTNPQPTTHTPLWAVGWGGNTNSDPRNFYFPHTPTPHNPQPTTHTSLWVVGCGDVGEIPILIPLICISPTPQHPPTHSPQPTHPCGLWGCGGNTNPDPSNLYFPYTPTTHDPQPTTHNP